MGCSIEPLESLQLISMVESNKKEDMIRENEYLEETKKMNRGKRRIAKSNQGSKEVSRKKA